MHEVQQINLLSLLAPKFSLVPSLHTLSGENEVEFLGPIPKM